MTKAIVLDKGLKSTLEEKTEEQEIEVINRKGKKPGLIKRMPHFKNKVNSNRSRR
jgi:hypothetical protein